jgi:hypothetical protein
LGEGEGVGVSRRRLVLEARGSGLGVAEVLVLLLGDSKLGTFLMSFGENAKLERFNLPLKLAGAVDIDAEYSSSCSSASSLTISAVSMPILYY